jgi:hypothetical protein
METYRGQQESNLALRVNPETGLCGDWINEFAFIYTGILDEDSFSLVEKHVKNGRRLQTYERRFANCVMEGGLITDKNREAVKHLDVLVVETNAILDRWASGQGLPKDERERLLEIFSEMQQIIRGPEGRVT